MDDSHIGLIVIVLVILIVLSALFSSSETAYSSLNQIRLKQMAKSGNRKMCIRDRLMIEGNEGGKHHFGKGSDTGKHQNWQGTADTNKTIALKGFLK